MDRLYHAITPNEQNGLSAHSGSYQVDFQPDGVRILPRPPAQADLSNARVPTAAATIRAVNLLSGPQRFTPPGTGMEWATKGNTAQALWNNQVGVVEHWEACGDGLFVTWILQQPLPGNDGATLELEIDGLDASAQSAAGLHFADASGLARLCLGPAELVDSAGQRWNLATHAAGNHLAIDVPADLLRSARFPVAIDPFVSAEFGVDQPVPGIDNMNQYNPVVAGGTTNFLVAWRHHLRVGSDDHVDMIRFARTLPDGTVLDPIGVTLYVAPASIVMGKILAGWNGQEFVVVWRSYNYPESSDDLRLARIGPDGRIRGVVGEFLANDLTFNQEPAMACNGSGCMVVWSDGRNTTANPFNLDLTGLFFDSKSDPMLRWMIPIIATPESQSSPAIAASSNGFLVAWEETRGITNGTSITYSRDILATLLDNQGAVLTATPIPVCLLPGNEKEVAVASDGARFLVAWTDPRNADVTRTNQSDVYGARISAEGQVLDPAGIPISLAPGTQEKVQLGFDGVRYLAVWLDMRSNPTPYASSDSIDLYGSYLTPAGAVLNPQGFEIDASPHTQWDTAIGSIYDAFLVAWLDRVEEQFGAHDVVGNILLSGSTAQDSDLISAGSNSQQYPAVAAGSNGWLVVWSDNRFYYGPKDAGEFEWDLYGARIDAAGRLQDSEGFVISDEVRDQVTPSVSVSGPTNYLVVWVDSRHAVTNSLLHAVYGARVSADGAVLDPHGFPVSLAGRQPMMPRVAWNGARHFVVWTMFTNTTANIYPQIWGALLDTSGSVLQADIRISALDSYQQWASVAASDSQFLVAWQDARNSTNYHTDIYAARVDADGALLDPAGFPVCTASGYQESVTLGGNSSGYLVVWQDDREQQPGIYFARVDRQGQVSPPDGIRLAAGVEEELYAPSIATSGDEFLVAWRRAMEFSRPNDDFEEIDEYALPYTWAARISASGQVIDPSPVRLDANLLYGLPVAIAGNGSRYFMATPKLNHMRVSRVVGRIIDMSGTNTNVPGPLPRFLPVTMLHGRPLIRYEIDPARTYVLESSLNLIDWTPVQVIHTDGQPTSDYWDVDDEEGPSRFFRIMELP